jgi:Na+-translocating ferredoxin:NAD+ oxidoreductase subunit E
MIREELKRGIITENPLLILVLGLCPALAISTSLQNAVGMGATVTFVLFGSNCIISLFRRWIPEKVRIPGYILIIATFVTIAQLLIEAFSPQLDQQLGIYVPLIVVNCIVLGRAEAYASKNRLIAAGIDGIVMGLGFTAALIILGSLREILGNNQLWGRTVIPGFQPMMLFILPPGGFLTLGLVLGFIHFLRRKKEPQ